MQAQRASVEAQEVALLAERERLMQDGHRQRDLEEELRRLQNEHDRYRPSCSPAPDSPDEHPMYEVWLGWLSHSPCVVRFTSSLGVWPSRLLESSLSLPPKSSEATG